MRRWLLRLFRVGLPITLFVGVVWSVLRFAETEPICGPGDLPLGLSAYCELFDVFWAAEIAAVAGLWATVAALRGGWLFLGGRRREGAWWLVDAIVGVGLAAAGAFLMFVHIGVPT